VGGRITAVEFSLYICISVDNGISFTSAYYIYYLRSHCPASMISELGAGCSETIKAVGTRYIV
jgi:hypothetical protein